MAARAGEYHIHSRFCIGVVAVSGDQRLCRKFGRKFLTLNGDRLTRDALGDARVRERRIAKLRKLYADNSPPTLTPQMCHDMRCILTASIEMM